ncbi:hypothetical protein MIN45_P1380 [Methylomarinovum tepidoasis]|uniref:Putative DNA-binding domain-containing protein n=1 Tax=Methylomarinovum tepidoasis TaxID=2840183 RepID=A0AAU9C9A9_9GAMM|nr:DNA-binding domain-containing protein [Methylomarinovum sp. IN45]BCX89010.1 hypothetical protein MIN45_P1380 [Methylomarinovum sp. IN45]
MKLRERQRQLQQEIVTGRRLDWPGLAIYQNAYRLRLTEALAVDYPLLRRWLGEAAFTRLARDYLAAYPSRHFSIRRIGRRLPEFLARQGEAALADFAAFEWALGLAFDCADARALRPADLAAVPPQDWPGLRFRFHPSVQLLWQRHAILPLWRALQAGDPPPACPPLETPVPVLIWRRELRQFFRSLTPEEAGALERLRQGEDFAACCEWLARRPAVDDAAHRIASWLQCWLREGLIVGFRV